MGVYLYVPNLIGYARVVFAFVAFWFAFDDWMIFVGCYAISQLLDAFDGMAARWLNQSSKFGAVLDMVTDRFCTNILLAILVHLYKDNKVHYMIFISLAVLDYVSHWCQFSANLMKGGDSHKNVKDSNFLMRLYYEQRWMLFLTCASQEAFLMGVYVLKFISEGHWFYEFTVIGLYVAAPLTFFKQGVNFLQMKEACDKIVAIDTESKAK